MTYTTKVCQRCGKEYQPTGGTQEYCKECGRIRARERRRLSDAAWYKMNAEIKAKYRKANPEQCHKSSAKYRKANLEKCHTSCAKYRKANLEKCNEAGRKWHKMNPEASREAHAKWAKAEPEQLRKAKVKYRKGHPEQEQLHCAKRRDLAFGCNCIPTNPWFPGCDRHHHQDLVHVTYMPRWMHRGKGNDHNHITGKGMAEMDAKALAYAGLSSDVLDDVLPFD